MTRITPPGSDGKLTYSPLLTVTTEERNAIPTPTEGMVVWNLTLHVINVYNGTSWISIGSLNGT